MLFQSTATTLLLFTNLITASAFTPHHVPLKASPVTTTSLFKKKASGKKKSSSGGKGFGAAVKQIKKEDSFPYAGTIRPGVQSPQKVVIDESIMKPDYAIDGRVRSKYEFSWLQTQLMY